MISDYFYHTTIRRFVAAFGTIFNDIKIAQTLSSDPNIPNKSFVRVPLSYGPRDKYLARIIQQTNSAVTNFAIKLPRMSFEISGLTYDTQSKLNKNNKILIGEKVYYTFSPYNISISLSIMTKTQDEALQILEQIVPYFQPDFTITIKEGIDNTLKTDVPITLTNITMAEDYEGDFMSRRAIIYTLDFEAKIRFYGPERKTGLIKKVKVQTSDYDNRANGYELQTVSVNPSDTTPPSQDYEIIYEVNMLDVVNTNVLTVSKEDVSGSTFSYVEGENVVGANGAKGYLSSITVSNNVIELVIVNVYDGDFSIGETLYGQTSGANKTILNYTKTYV